MSFSGIRHVAIYTWYITAFTIYASAFVSTRTSLSYHHIPTTQSKSHAEDVQIYPINTLQIGSDNIQPLVPDIAYYYLSKTIGLDEETMWKITLEAGSVLGMTPRNLEKKVSLLKRTMDLSDDDVREILGKQPAILHLSADRNLAPTILLLVRALDLSKSELRSIITACPSILGYSLENIKEKLSFFMDTLGYNHGNDDGKDNVRELILQEPRLLTCGVKSGLIPRMKFLHREIQFSLKDLRILYQKNPKLLLYSLDNNLREKIVFFFILQLQMEPEHVRKILLTYPQVVDYNLDNHMKPIIEYCVSELEFSATELRSIILRFPRLFTYSLFKIKHVVGFLRYELALDAQQVKRVIFQAPQIIGLDTEVNMKGKLNFLQQRMGLTQEELAQFVAKMPTLFCLNVDTSLIPKFEYLERSLHTAGVLKEALLKQPVLLGYSLERIQSRMEHLSAAGIASRKITVGISMTEKRFHQWVASSQSRLEISQWNSAGIIYLRNSLELTNDDICFLCAELPNLPQATVMQVKSQISYLRKEFKDQDIKRLILKYPHLIDKSLKVRQRIKKLRLAGLLPNDNVERLACYDDDDFNAWIAPLIQDQVKRETKSDILFLTERLALKSAEAQNILASFPELECTVKRKGLHSKVEFLLTEFNNEAERVKSLLISHPQIVDVPTLRIRSRLEKMSLANITDLHVIGTVLVMSKRQFRDVPQRMQLMIDCGSSSYMSHSILFGSQAASEKALFVSYLRKRLGFKSEDADKVLDVIATKRPFLKESLQKLDYLQTEAFENSPENLKQALLANPELLRKPLKRTLVPRVQTIQDLRLVGLECTPGEIGKLLSSSIVKYKKLLAPSVKTWDSSTIKLKSKGTQEAEEIRALLQEHVQSLVVAYSHDFNREDAKIVHWR